MPKTNINDIFETEEGKEFKLDTEINEERIKQRFDKLKRLKEQAEERKKVDFYELENFIVENNYNKLNNNYNGLNYNIQ